ncbi:hypothetical protein AAEO56_10560 [Flavobacterium sp. DGU11]|uniref:Transmembrane protein n=1 Tax=Flavobacterium arundinis TaxID=3139143 RepID=A0ABU9HY96_9FLAO
MQNDPFSCFLIALLTIDFVFMLWMVIYIKFDVAGRRFKKEYTVGLLRLGMWRKLPQIDYISVFKQLGSSDEGESLFIRYDVNVWYNDTKHFTIYTHPDKSQSYSMAMRLAVKLNVDMLDATIPNDFKWVELPVKDICI